MAYKASQKDEEKKLSSSFKTRFGSLDGSVTGSPTIEKVNLKPKSARNDPATPVLRAKDSQADLIFDMDEEESFRVGGPSSPTGQRSKRAGGTELSGLSKSQQDPKGKAVDIAEIPTASSSSPQPRPQVPFRFATEPVVRKAPESSNPWGPSNLATPRLDLREILAESRPAHSALSAGLAAEKKNAVGRPTPQKMSQKEKKKYLQQKAEEAAHEDIRAPHQPWTTEGEKKKSPWQPTTSTPVATIKGMLAPDLEPKRPSPTPKPPVAAEASSAMKSIPRRTASPDTRFAGQRPNTVPVGSGKTSRPEPQAQPLVPHSKSYIKRTPKPEAEMGVGLADIIGQQQREQQSVKEAVAKRSLQEIQQEQAFQEWWDQESKRMQEEEARRAVARDKEKENDKGRGEKEGGGRRGRGNKSKGGGNRGGGNRGGATGGGTSATAESSSASTPAGGRGRGRGSRGGRAR